MPKKTLPPSKPPADRLKSVQVFSRNVEILMDAAKAVAQSEASGLSQIEIAKLGGVSLRTLAYQKKASGKKSAPTLRTIEAVAKAFGLEPWQLLLPDLPRDIVLDAKLRQRVQATITRYLRTTNPKAREGIDSLAELLPQP